MKDQLQTIREAQPPFGFVRMNPGFNSGVFHQGAECPPGWPGAIAVYHAAPVAQQPHHMKATDGGPNLLNPNVRHKLATEWGYVKAQQPQAEAITEAAIDAYLDDYEMRGETEDGRDACYAPSEGEKFLIKDAIMGLLAEAPLQQPQAEAVPPTLTPAGQRWADDAAVESRKDQS